MFQRYILSFHHVSSACLRHFRWCPLNFLFFFTFVAHGVYIRSQGSVISWEVQKGDSFTLTRCSYTCLVLDLVSRDQYIPWEQCGFFTFSVSRLSLTHGFLTLMVEGSTQGIVLCGKCQLYLYRNWLACNTVLHVFCSSRWNLDKTKSHWLTCYTIIPPDEGFLYPKCIGLFVTPFWISFELFSYDLCFGKKLHAL